MSWTLWFVHSLLSCEQASKQIKWAKHLAANIVAERDRELADQSRAGTGFGYACSEEERRCDNRCKLWRWSGTITTSRGKARWQLWQRPSFVSNNLREFHFKVAPTSDCYQLNRKQQIQINAPRFLPPAPLSPIQIAKGRHIAQLLFYRPPSATAVVARLSPITFDYRAPPPPPTPTAKPRTILAPKTMPSGWQLSPPF